MMTELTITPKVADKTARFKGAVAAGEHVAVTIKGGAEWIGTDNGANLTLRVLDLVTGRTLAVFPYWTEDNQEDWPEDVTSADAWETSGDDNADLSCTLNLNTLRMVAAARHMLRVPAMFVLGDAGDPRTLYFRDRYEVEYWPERIGDTVPYDLDKWPKKIDDWTELVTGWTAKLNGMKLTAVPFTGKVVSGVSKNGVTITLNDGDDTTDTVVDLFDGEVSAAQMNAAIAAMGSTKQNTLTFDDVPTAESDNPVKSGGVYGAVKGVADAVTEHTGNTGIHVTAEQKTAWTAKYNKPSGGIPKSDLASSVQASLGKADSAIQEHQSLAAYVNGGVYDGDTKKILLKHDSVTVAEIDATAFIKDGMVDSVEISGGNLVISFNTDAGVEDIEIPLTDIFNPSNYYDKTAADGRFVQKEAGKGLFSGSYNDLTDKPTIPAPVDISGKLDGAAAYPAWVPTPEIESESNYHPGDVVSHAGRLWECNAEATISEPVSSSGDWIEYTIDDLKQDALSSAQLAAANSGATAAKVATWDGYAAQIALKANAADVATALAQKADASDLPYALVEPGKWAFSELPSGYSDPVCEWNSSESVMLLTMQHEGDDFEIGNYNVTQDSLSVTFAWDEGPGTETYTVIATRPSLPGHLLDRVGNRVVVSGDTTLTLPSAVPGYIRDFLVRLEISGSTVPTITFAAPTGETITYETDGDEFPVPDEAGTWLYSFTESCVAHKFAVSLKKVNEVAAPQAQGGS